MGTETLIKIFKRDLDRLKGEIESYNDEKNLWVLKDGISNCAGNLCLHLVGNLNHFIGAEFGKSGYVRQRDLEFSLKDVPRTELIKQVNDVKLIVENTLKTLTHDDLQKEYSRRVFEDKMTTEFFLTHLTTHLAYHLGQINYHRRLLDS
ncbi:DinB family protein [Jejuia spongiicola]|uniref:DinB family protein n=1 Tax=Jejuia spongiicola TaxID=2942207 RepID=A0ABT0QGD3_9FLAO|nr:MULTISPECIES: DinB family protein [Flavobacteriaceae]MCL6296038.1 DinB family protein [Jejuia spongiicola]PIA80360.1 DinB superfamily protein [Gaetbulibacter sp. 4G1]